MQRLREIPQEVYDFLRNFRLRAGDLNRDSPGCLLLPLRGNSPCGGSKTAPFTHPLPGVHAPLAGISILQQTLFYSFLLTNQVYNYRLNTDGLYS